MYYRVIAALLCVLTSMAHAAGLEVTNSPLMCVKEDSVTAGWVRIFDFNDAQFDTSVTASSAGISLNTSVTQLGATLEENEMPATSTFTDDDETITATWTFNDGVVVASDSESAVDLTAGTLTVPNSASTTVTTEGRCEWNSTTDRYHCGDGSASQRIGGAATGASIYHNTTQEVNNDFTILTFNSEWWDSDNLHIAAADCTGSGTPLACCTGSGAGAECPKRIYIATTGKYNVQCVVGFAANNNGSRWCDIYKNGAALEGVAAPLIPQSGGVFVDWVQDVRTGAALAAGDYIECLGYESSTTSGLDVVANTTLRVVWVGK